MNFAKNTQSGHPLVMPRQCDYQYRYVRIFVHKSGIKSAPVFAALSGSMTEAKDLLILGCCVLLILPISLYVAVHDHAYHNNIYEVMEREVQYCVVNSDCSSFYSSCGSNLSSAISIKNEQRYLELKNKYCDVNPPRILVHFHDDRFPACVNGVCEMLYEYKPFSISEMQ